MLDSLFLLINFPLQLEDARDRDLLDIRQDESQSQDQY